MEQEKNTLTVLEIAPGQYPKQVEIDPDLKALQQAVGGNIKDFDRYAKRYHIDYAIQKDLSCTPPRFLIFFKAQDADALNAAFKEYSAAVLNKAERPSVLTKLHDLAQVIANLPDKVRHKEEERGL